MIYLKRVPVESLISTLQSSVTLMTVTTKEESGDVRSVVRDPSNHITKSNTRDFGVTDLSSGSSRE